MDDLISRKQTHELLSERMRDTALYNACEDAGTILIDIVQNRLEKWLNELPSAQKTGKWIKDEEQSREHTEPIFICSCCQNNSAWGTEERTRYCSFCGAIMENES